MAALSSNLHLPHKGNPTKMTFSHNGSDEIYAGALVYNDTGGGCQVVPAAGDGFLGIACRRQTAVAGTEVEVYVDGIFKFPAAMVVTAADEGDIAIMDLSAATTDNPADCVSGLDATVAGDDILIGRILRVETDGVWILLHATSSVWVTGIGF